MVSTRLVLSFICCLPNIIWADNTNLPSAEYVTSEDDDLGIRGYILFHNYRFKKSSEFASELISTMMNYNVELGELVQSYVRGDTPDNELYNSKEEECYRRLIELPWFPTIKPNLITRLTAILTTLIEKDTNLAERVANCGKDNKACINHVTYRALIEIASYGRSELYNELTIKQDYLGKIKHEMDHCLNPTEVDIGEGGKK